MIDLSDKVVCVVDHGLYVELAIRLSREFGKVYFHSPWERSFPVVNDAVIGNGFDEIEWVDEIWEVLDQVDLFVFPDVLHSALQLHLESLGKRVWGSRTGDRLEIRRAYLKTVQKELGMHYPEYEVVRGLDALRERLRQVEDKYVKLSKYRGMMETFHHINYDLSEQLLDQLAVKFGSVKNVCPFLIEDPVKTDIEVGYDGYCVDGQFPELAIQGYEIKDRCLIASVQKYSEMPEEITVVNETLSPKLREFRYRNFWSTEIRVKDGDSYLIDPCCFSEDTEVLTNMGWKLFSDLLPSDCVCTLNPETNQIEYHIPEKYIAYRVDGDLVSISNRKRDLDLLVTKNHTVWGFLATGKWWHGRADKIPYALSIPRTGDWNGIELQHFVLPEYRNTWHSGRGRGIDRTIHNESVKIPMDIWLRFLAIYLAEGHCSQWSVTITQTIAKEEVREIIEALPFKWSENQKGFRCSSIQLVNHLRQFGLRSEKYIPDFVKTLSSRQINLFLDAYCLGDGHLKHGNRNITTPSERTANDIQELFLKCGSCASIKRNAFKGLPVTISGGKYVCSRDTFKIMERKKYTKFFLNGWSSSRAHRYLSKVPYSGMVYDVEVQNHILYVRRNGKPCWSGNCRCPSPCTEIQMELWENLGEILWEGAAGNLVNQQPAAQFGVEAIIDHNGDENSWRTLQIPDDIRRWVKIYNVCKVDDTYAIPTYPHSYDAIGAVVGIGDTIEEAIDQLKEHVEKLKDQPVTVKVEALYEAIEAVKKAENKGLEFTEQSVPEPESVL